MQTSDEEKILTAWQPELSEADIDGAAAAAPMFPRRISRIFLSLLILFRYLPRRRYYPHKSHIYGGPPRLEGRRHQINARL